MFDYAVEEGMEQIQAERQEMPLSFDNKECKEDIETRKKDDAFIEAFWARRNAESLEYFQSDEYKKEFQKMYEESNKKPMYDFGLDQMSTEGKIFNFYGGDIIRRVRKELRARQSGDVSKELCKIMKDMRAGKIAPKSKKQKSEKINNPQKTCRVPNKTIQIEKRSEENHFLMKNRGLIRNEAYLKMFKSSVTVYEWIWANLARKGWKDTEGYPIKKQYYDKGLLAYCSSYRKIGEKCFLHKNMVKKYIDEFREAGVIKVEHLTPVGKKRGQSVFILGKWKIKSDGGIEETLYLNEIFLEKKGDGQNVPN